MNKKERIKEIKLLKKEGYSIKKIISEGFTKYELLKAGYSKKDLYIINQKKTNLGILSIIFACGSLFLLPPFLGLAGIILGIIGITKNEGATAIIGLVLSFIFPFIGMILGLMVWVYL